MGRFKSSLQKPKTTNTLRKPKSTLVLSTKSFTRPTSTLPLPAYLSPFLHFPLGRLGTSSFLADTHHLLPNILPREQPNECCWSTLKALVHILHVSDLPFFVEFRNMIYKLRVEVGVIEDEKTLHPYSFCNK